MLYSGLSSSCKNTSGSIVVLKSIKCLWVMNYFKPRAGWVIYLFMCFCSLVDLTLTLEGSIHVSQRAGSAFIQTSRKWEPGFYFDSATGYLGSSSRVVAVTHVVGEPSGESSWVQPSGSWHRRWAHEKLSARRRNIHLKHVCCCFHRPSPLVPPHQRR